MASNPRIFFATGFQITNFPFSSTATRPSAMLSSTDRSISDSVSSAFCALANSFACWASFFSACLRAVMSVRFQNANWPTLFIAMQHPNTSNHQMGAVPLAMHQLTFPSPVTRQLFFYLLQRLGGLGLKQLMRHLPQRFFTGIAIEFFRSQIPHYDVSAGVTDHYLGEIQNFCLLS